MEMSEAKNTLSCKQQVGLLSTLETLRQQQIDTDVVLQCKRGVVHAHKFVLRNSCTYFESMFSVDMAENKSGVVDFQWCLQEALEVIVQFLYTGQWPKTNNFTLLVNVNEASHLMQLTDLLNYCWENMLNYLQVNTFVELWLIGLKFNLVKNDTGKLFSFVKDNIAGICENGNIECLDDEQFEELIDYLNCDEMSDQIIDCILKWKCKGDRDDAAARLFEKVNFGSLSSEFLQNLLGMYRGKKKKGFDQMLMEEAIGRFTKLHEISKEIIDSSLFNSSCSYSGANCQVYQSMTQIKTLCKRLPLK